MDAGALDKLVRIDRPTTTQDSDYGTKSSGWTAVDTVWANVQDVMPSKHGEAQVDGIRIARRPARIRIRYRTDIDSSMRVVLLSRGNRELRIDTQPAEIFEGEYLEFMASDFSTQGNAA